jgi:3-methylfumaryl-CoA hydratase
MSHFPLSDWIGRREVIGDRITEAPARALAATLNRADLNSLSSGAVLPSVWTWLYFIPLATMDQVGTDGHPKRGGFLPPIELPRRMWAGSRCTFHVPIRIGDDVQRSSTILRISEKTGRAGSLVFVTLRHEITTGGELAMEEEQDIVYLEIPKHVVAREPILSPAPDWSEAVKVDPVLLFRFSALTFNAHRIHYDREYAMHVEHYPGLVVQGPLQAILLFDAATRREPGKIPHRFDFQGLRPLFDFEALTVNGRAREDGGLDLFAITREGGTSMKAVMTF